MSDNGEDWFGFERLEVWQKSSEFARVVYLTTRGFPKEEMFGLTMQLRRASVSVVASIAEGASRDSGKERARFFEIAYGSLWEIAALLNIALGQGIIEKSEVDSLRSEVAKLCRMVFGLKRSARSPSK